MTIPLAILSRGVANIIQMRVSYQSLSYTGPIHKSHPRSHSKSISRFRRRRFLHSSAAGARHVRLAFYITGTRPLSKTLAIPCRLTILVFSHTTGGQAIMLWAQRRFQIRSRLIIVPKWILIMGCFHLCRWPSTRRRPGRRLCKFCRRLDEIASCSVTVGHGLWLTCGSIAERGWWGRGLSGGSFAGFEEGTLVSAHGTG